MLSISGSNSRKSVADWTLVNIHYFYKEGWICVSESDSLLVSLILSEKSPNTWNFFESIDDVIDHENDVGRDNELICIYGFS